jgi:hypothetical protein
MIVARETISVALFNLLKGNQSLMTLCKTITRTPIMWTDVADASKPFLTLFKGGPKTEGFEQAQERRMGLTRYTISYNLWLYVAVNPSGVILPETLVNNIADGIDAAMQTNLSTGGVIATARGERQTLGGIVNNAWIDGGSEWSREFSDNNLVMFHRILVETGV